MTAPLERLPTVGERRIAVRVTRDAFRQIRGGSPWLYDGSITSVSHDGAPGDLAVVFDDDRKFAAIGLWDPTSPIRLKVLHRGAPTQIDGVFWRTVLSTARDRRAGLEADDDDDRLSCRARRERRPARIGRRSVRPDAGRQDVHAGVVPAPGRRRSRRSSSCCRPFGSCCGSAGRSRAATRSVSTTATRSSVPAPEGPILFRERDLTMEADVVHGQKTGHFLDQRDNRALVRSMAAGAIGARRVRQHRRVLVGCCGRGRQFGAPDRSIGAGARDRQEEPRPQPSSRRGSALPGAHHGRRRVQGDGRLAAKRERFDIIIVDPPSFASNQAAVPRALAAYARLTHLALGLVQAWRHAADGVVLESRDRRRVRVDRAGGRRHRRVPTCT